MKNDQAQRLRELVSVNKSRARVLSFASGKGGVGKTNVSLALALSLTAMKKKVTLVDCDLGLANINVLLKAPHRRNLSHVLEGRYSLEDITVQGPGGLRFVPGANGLSELADLTDARRHVLLRQLETLEKDADFVIVDIGAGLSKNVLALSAAADDVVLVTTPEPTAILDVYSMLRQLSRRRRCGRLQLMINMVPSRQVAVQVADRLVGASRQYLQIDLGKLGYVLHDEHVPESVIRRRSFVLEYPQTDASRCVEAVARHLARLPRPVSDEPGFFERLLGQLWGKTGLKAG